MKNNSISKILLIFASVVILTGSNDTHKVIVRPVKLRVVDAGTEQPLKNILVYYILESYVYKDKIFLFFRRPEPKVVKKTEVKKECYTDENGVVQFEARELTLKKDEELYQENIYINLDIKLDEITLKNKDEKDKIANFHYNMIRYITEKKYFFNPNPKYKGFHINSTTWDLDPKDWGGSTRDKFDILWNGKGLLKDKEEFIIKLKRY